MHNYIIKNIEVIDKDTLILRLNKGEYDLPLSFQPGQYAAISYYHKGRKSAARCFSIVSSPIEQNLLEFGIRLGGRYTNELIKLKENDIVNVYGPYGGFVFNHEIDQKVVFLAGGIGITPFLSMLRYAKQIKANNLISLFYSVSNPASIPFQTELLDIAESLDNTQLKFVSSHGEFSSNLKDYSLTGHIDAQLIKDCLQEPLTNYKFYICGPPGFMSAIRKSLLSNNVPENKILTEAFSQIINRQSGILRSWPANIYALSIISLILVSLFIASKDLVKALPPNSDYLPTKRANFLVTNAKHQSLNQIVNSIPPSPAVITIPSSQSTPIYKASSTPTNQSNISTNSSPPSFAPVYIAPKTITSPSKLP